MTATFKDKILNVTTKSPYALQFEGIRFLHDTSYCILGDEMGLGKTLQAIIAAYLTGKRTLVVCPANLRQTWKMEIENTIKAWVDIELFENQTLAYPQNDTQFVIISYNMLVHCEHLFDWAQIVIGDECQALKERTSIQSELFNKYLYEYIPDKLMLMSGTPLINDVTEWWSILSMCSYSTMGDNGLDVHKAFPEQIIWNRLFTFKKTIGIGGGRYVEKYTGFRNKEILKKYLRGKYLRRLAKNELDLPKLLSKEVIISFKDDLALQEAWEAHQKDKSKGSAAKAKSALVKAPFTAQYAKDIQKAQGSPVLVYTDHRDSAAKLGKDLKCPVITGLTTILQREALVKKFQSGQIPHMVCTIGSMGTGRTLTKARDLILNDISWKPGENAQVYKRIHRIGQLYDCTIHHIIGSRQDQHIKKINREKEAVLREAM